jgi:hypothetical protein
MTTKNVDIQLLYTFTPLFFLKELESFQSILTRESFILLLPSAPRELEVSQSQGMENTHFVMIRNSLSLAHTIFYLLFAFQLGITIPLRSNLLFFYAPDDSTLGNHRERKYDEVYYSPGFKCSMQVYLSVV